MITIAITIIGVCVCIYIILQVLSALLEWIGLAFGVLALVAVAYVGFRLISGAFEAPAAHTAPHHVAHHAASTTL